MKKRAPPKGECFYCGRATFRVDSKGTARHDLRPDQRDTRDHIIPASQGGKLNSGNMVNACQRCNMARGDHPAMFFLEFAFEVIRPLNIDMNTKAASRQFCMWMLEKRFYPDDRQIPKAVRVICEEVAA